MSNQLNSLTERGLKPVSVLAVTNAIPDTYMTAGEANLIRSASMPESLLIKRLKSGVCRVDEFGSLEKRCSQCKEYWPADTDFFYSTRSTKDGLNNWCRACYVENRYPNTRGAVGHQFNVRGKK